MSDLISDPPAPTHKHECVLTSCHNTCACSCGVTKELNVAWAAPSVSSSAPTPTWDEMASMFPDNTKRANRNRGSSAEPAPPTDDYALAWRKRATQSEMEMEELMSSLKKLTPDELKPRKYADLNPEERAAIDDYMREMQEEVIPRIVDTMRERARIAAEIRHRVLFA